MPNMPARKDDPLRGKKTGKWTKYGGAVFGLVKQGIEDTWFCQICADQIPEEIKPFLIEMFPGDFIRICPRCTHIASSRSTYSVHRIIKIVRIKRD